MRIDGRDFRTIWLDEGGRDVWVIDQRRLPHRFETLRLTSAEAAAAAIADMTVRGAPLIGATAAYGMALAAGEDASDAGLEHAAATLQAARPTAVNLRWAVERMRHKLTGAAPSERRQAAYAEAALIADEDVAVCESIGEHGRALIEAAKTPGKARVDVLTHCNAGWLCAVDWGTALAPIYKAHRAGIPVHVWVDETRPSSQAVRLAPWLRGRVSSTQTCTGMPARWAL